jgi:hypothetical protein
VLTVIGFAWMISAGLFSVIVTFPATRYIDTASVLLPAVVTYWAALLLQWHPPAKPSYEGQSARVAQG